MRQACFCAALMIARSKAFCVTSGVLEAGWGSRVLTQIMATRVPAQQRRLSRGMAPAAAPQGTCALPFPCLSTSFHSTDLPLTQSTPSE